MSEVPAGTDPITTEIIRSALVSAAQEMNASLVRSAYTPLIYEAKDCSVGLFNERAELLGQAAGLPIFMGNLEEAINVTTQHLGADIYQEGDVYIINDSYLTGTHLGDITIFSPIFFEGDLVGFAASRAHLVDIGGKDPNVSVDNTNIYQDGIRIPPTRLFHRGEPVPEVMNILRYNSRYPHLLIGDIYAQVAACRMGERRFHAILAKFGRSTVEHAARDIFAQSEQMDREAIEALPDGEYFAEGCLDDDGWSDDPVWVRVKVTIAGPSMTIDLTGSSPQVKGCVNCGHAQTISACRVAYKMLVNPQSGVTGGSFRWLNVVVPEGSIFSAQEPASCQFYFTPLGLLIDLVIKALADALPDQVAAAHYGDSMLSFLIGQDFICPGNNMGGWGASATSDGENGLVNVVNGDLRNVPVELVEHKYPLQVRRYGLIPDSGGPGRFRGGLGVVRDVEVLADDVVLSTWFERSRTPAWGLFQGKDGTDSHVVVNPGEPTERVVRKVNRLPVPRGTVVSARTGGGGGYGCALERDPEAVRDDLIDGYVTVDAARQAYGVAICPDSHDIDLEATTELRRAQTTGSNLT